MASPEIREVIRRCKASVAWFLRNFGKIKHQSAGIIDFYPFSYQRKALQAFRKYRFNIFRKCRQAGASKICGAFALWFAMFHSNKTILIVSRTDEDAMGFLREQIVFLFNNLPKWMQEMWKPTKQTDHEIVFPNGSRIRSLSSHPDVLRSNSSSLNIVDEAAFIKDMDAMWAAGFPTLQHGGSIIIVSTTAGVGGWYWSTMTDAEAGVGSFNPIVINWYDMDWVIEYVDPLSLERRRIAPRDGILKCDNNYIDDPKYGRVKLDETKYGPYWSPWLEEQYRALQSKGEGWKFDQEILARFVGSGNTVISKEALEYVRSTVVPPVFKATGIQTYVHPVTGERLDLDFDFDEPDEGLWIWAKPVLAKAHKTKNNVIIQRGSPAHAYVMGVDIATGRAKDCSAIVVFDIDTRKQVAEFMVHCLPSELVMYIDRIGRYYNNALAVVELNNGGDIVIHMLRNEVLYPNVWRRKEVNDTPRVTGGGKPRALKVGAYGHNTNQQSKQSLNKLLIDFIRPDDSGYIILSSRLLGQLEKYIRKRDRVGRDTGRTEAEEGAGNFDDLVMACGLAFVGSNDAINVDVTGMAPVTQDIGQLQPINIMSDANAPSPVVVKKTDDGMGDRLSSFAMHGGPGMLAPFIMAPDELPDESAKRAIEEYALQIGGIPASEGKPIVTPNKYYFEKR